MRWCERPRATQACLGRIGPLPALEDIAADYLANPNISEADKAEVRAMAREDCWWRGDIRWKLDRDQRADFDLVWPNFDDPTSRPTEDVVAAISRQRGKSFWACALVTMFALRFRNVSIKYASKTQKSVYSIVEPQFRTILADCPPELMPEFSRMDGRWVWPNGSNATIAGTDNKHYENLRGTSSHLNVKDEAGFFDDYEEVDAVLSPQLLTTGGITIEISTPPESAGHPFEGRFRAAMARGKAINRSIWGHPRMSEQEIRWFLTKEAQKRGMELEEFLKTTYCRREFGAEFVTEETRAVVPGWTQERARENVVALERPKFFDAYVGIDFGYGDPHGAAFAYLDFERQWLVVEDEVSLRHVNTEVLIDSVKAKEAELWGNSKWSGTLRGASEIESLPTYLRDCASEGATRQPYLRMGDNDNLTLADCHQKHGYTVIPSEKDNKHLQCDLLDIMVRRNQLKIHPRCVNLVRELHTTIWNKPRTSFERTPNGHGDVLDGLIFICRAVRWHRDPRPKNWGINPDNAWVRPAGPNPLLAALGLTDPH